MSLTAINALISVKNGTAAPVNLAPGDVGIFTPGNQLTFSLQSTVGIQLAEFTLLCPAYPGLHQLTYSWQPGQYNGWQITFPESAIVDVASTIAGVNLVVTVTDCSASSVTASNYLESYISWADGSYIAASAIAIGDAFTYAASGVGMVVATTAALAASPSGVIEGVAISAALSGRPFIAANDGRLTATQAPFVGPVGLIGTTPYAIVNSVGHIVRASSPTDKCIGVCGLDGSVTLSLEQWGGFLGGGNQPAPTISAITPSKGFRRGSGLDGGVVTGTNFTVDSVVSIGGINCIVTTYINSTTLNITTPTLPSDSLFNVTVTNPGAPPATLTNGYEVISSIWWARTRTGFSGAAWADLADTPHNAAQSNVGNQPLFAAGTINGRASLNFATSKWMLIANSLVTANSAYTVVFVGKQGNGAPFSIRATTKYSGSSLFLLFGTYYVHGDGVTAGANVTTADYSAITNNAAVPFKSIHRYKGASADPDIYLQGILRAITSVGTGQTTEDGTVGAQVGAATAAGAQPWNGYIGEVIVFNSAITAGQRASVDQYILEEWGIAL